MRAPAYSTADFLAALQALLPRGRVWPRDADAVQTKTLSSMAPSLLRVVQRANNLLSDAFPSTAFEMLPEWEETLGLPDPCAGPSPTLQLRRAQVVNRLVGIGNQSVPYMISYAGNLGYEITIDQFVPARVGRYGVGHRLNGEAWAHALQINFPEYTINYSKVGYSTVGEPLASWGNQVLECEMQAIAPAHAVLIFVYGARLNVDLVLDSSALS